MGFGWISSCEEQKSNWTAPLTTATQKEIIFENQTTTRNLTPPVSRCRQPFGGRGLPDAREHVRSDRQPRWGCAERVRYSNDYGPDLATQRQRSPGSGGKYCGPYRPGREACRGR